MFAVSSFAGSNQGGADSPEALGLAMMQSVENEDMLGLIDVMLPGERDLFRESAVDFVNEFIRLELLSPAADLSQIAGVDLDIENEAVFVRPTNVDDISNVAISGLMTATVDGEALPIGNMIDDVAAILEVPSPDRSQMSGSGSEAIDTEFTAVERDGRWYFSMMYTAAEFARQEVGLGEIPVTGLTPIGGDSPEEAVDLLFKSVIDLNLSDVIATLNPGEAEALQRYAPLFLDEAQSELTGVPLQWSLEEAEYSTTGSGNRRTVAIETLAIEGVAEGVPFSLEYRNGCAIVSADGETFDLCDAVQSVSAELDDFFADAKPIADLVDRVELALNDIGPIGITVREFDGKWYVSPIGTYVDVYLTVLRALDADEIREIVALIPPAIEWFGNEITGGMFDPGMFSEELDTIVDDALQVDGSTELEAIPDDALQVDGSTELEVVPDEPGTAPLEVDAPTDASECWKIVDVDEAIACFGAELELDPDSWVPVELRYPECGLSDRYWSGGYSQLSDEEFTTLLADASGCFDELVSSEQIDSFFVPWEVDVLNCFEGRNWFNEFEDAVYLERVEACFGTASSGD